MHGCQYCYCEITLDDTYEDIVEYYNKDMEYWSHRLHYQWLHLSFHLFPLDDVTDDSTEDDDIIDEDDINLFDEIGPEMATETDTF